MLFEWSETKRDRTLTGRGLDFADARHLFDGRPVYSFPSAREGEARVVSIGLLERRCVAVVWLDRNGARRIISMRRARRGEEAVYRKLFG